MSPTRPKIERQYMMGSHHRIRIAVYANGSAKLLLRPMGTLRNPLAVKKTGNPWEIILEAVESEVKRVADLILPIVETAADAVGIKSVGGAADATKDGSDE